LQKELPLVLLMQETIRRRMKIRLLKSKEKRRPRMVQERPPRLKNSGLS
jgi:hypothetical protein